MRFSDLEGKQIAIVIEREQERTVCRGIAEYVFDEDLGHCLKVPVPEQPGEPSFLLPEATGDYEIRPDHQYGCDYAISL